MKQRSVNSDILRLAIPNVISNITVPLLGMADAAIAGRLGGDAPIGAVALGTTIFNFMYWNCAFIRMGTSGLTAQAFGRRDSGECASLLVRALCVALVLASAILLLQRPLISGAVAIMGGSEAVQELVRSYVSARIWAVPAAISVFALHGWFIGMQDSISPMIVSIFSNVVNVAASVFFTFGCDMGIDGIAWGTVAAQYASLLLSAGIVACKYRGVVRSASVRTAIVRSEMLKFFAVNRDIFLRTFCVVVAYTMFSVVSARFGDVVLATNSLLMQLFTLFSYMSDGLAYAAESLSGRFIGERNYPRLSVAVRQLMIMSAVVAVGFVGIYVVGWRQILGLFNPSEAVLGCAAQYVVWVIAVPLAGFVPFMIDGIMIGATRTRPLRNTVAISLGVYLAAMFALLPVIGNSAIWVAFLAFISLRGVLLVPELKRLLRGE